MNSFELALVLASALLHAWWSVAIKGSEDPIAFNLLQEVAPLGLLLALLPLMDLGQVPPAAWQLLGVSGFAHGLYFYWMSRAYEHGDLTLVYPIARSTPAFLPLVSVPLLGESISVGGGLGIATVVGGMWLVTAGPGLGRAAFLSPAARYASLTLAATVAYSLLDKGAMAELAAAPWSGPVPRAAFYCLALSAASALVFAPLALHRRGVRALREAAHRSLGPATAAAGISFVGYALILRALETAPVSYVVAARQTSVLFALVLGMVRLRESPGRPRVIGAMATVVGVVLIALFS